MLSDYLGALAIFLAGAAIWQQMSSAKRDRLRAFEDNYVQRYWAISDRWSLAVMLHNAHSISDDDQLAIRAYIQLCEDEWDIRRLGWISKSSWKSWLSAIRQGFKNPVIAEVWARVEAETRGNPKNDIDESFSGLRQILAQNSGHLDPRNELSWYQKMGLVKTGSK